jgi:hypothetical protein
MLQKLNDWRWGFATHQCDQWVFGKQSLPQPYINAASAMAR